MSINNLTKAKAQLVMDHPFFASLLLGMPIEPDMTEKTLSTNGEDIRYNPEYLKTLDLKQTLFVLAHEVMHCVFQHMHRRNDRNPNKWNIAGDYIINDLLIKENIGIMPHGGLHNPQLVKQGNETTEGVYNLLPDEDEGKEPGSGPGMAAGGGEPNSGGSLDNCKDAGKDAAEIAQKAEEMKVKIVQAQNAAKMAGKMSANLQRIVKEFTKTETDWRSILRHFISQRSKIELTFGKPKRRFLADDIYLPSLSGEKMGAVTIAIDCSGSVDPELLKKFASEVKSIIEDTQPEMVNVLYFDSEVLRQDDFGPDQEFEVKAVGGGGTAFSPIFKHIENHQLEPVCCIVLTDLYCDDYGPAPNYPVLFASTAKTEGNQFGEVIKIK